MALNYEYSYAVIDLETGECLHVFSDSEQLDISSNPEIIVIPEYEEEYLYKWYNQSDKKWYNESTFETEYIPS